MQSLNSVTNSFNISVDFVLSEYDRNTFGLFEKVVVNFRANPKVEGIKGLDLLAKNSFQDVIFLSWFIN